jgi:hypothetical protein
MFVEMPESEAELQALIVAIRKAMSENAVNDLEKRIEIYTHLRRVSAIDSEIVESGRLAKVNELTFGLFELEKWQAKFKAYGTTLADCGCPDHQPPGGGSPRTVMCKHMLAYRILFSGK